MNNSVKWRRIVVKQINDYLSTAYYLQVKSNTNLNDEMKANDSKMSMRWNNDA